MRHSCFILAIPLTIAAIAVAVTASSTADARAVGGYMGAPQNPSTSQGSSGYVVTGWECYEETWGGVQKTGTPPYGCGPTAPAGVWEIPLPIDNWNQTDFADVYYYAPNHGDVACNLISGNGNGGEYEGSGYITPAGSGVGVFVINNIYVPGGGYLFLACELNQYAVIHEVAFNQ